MSGKYLSPPECPFNTIGSLLYEISNQGLDPNDYQDYIVPTTDKYHSFNEFRRRVKSGLEIKYCWWLTRLSRNRTLIDLTPLEDKPLPPGLPEQVIQALLNSPDYTQHCRFNNLHEFGHVLSLVDRYTTHSAMLGILEQIGERAHFEHLVNNLVDDEAISSSQLEGAATTTILAKEMIRKKRKPRTNDERMIFGNFDLMKSAWEFRGEPFSIELIRNLHSIGTKTLEPEKYTPGVFRITDDIAVVNAEGEVVHQPPRHDSIERLLARVVKWLNSNDNSVHPVIQAITLHFVIGYVHPFRDGNGRVARALFYWYMFKSGYTGFRYIAISAMLKEAPIQYGVSYLDAEHDNLDLTYFIKYQLKVIARAIDEFVAVFQRAARRMQELEKRYSGLEDIERTIIGFVSGEPRYRKKPTVTAREVENLLGISYNSAKQKLDEMAAAGILASEKIGKSTEYFLV